MPSWTVSIVCHFLNLVKSSMSKNRGKLFCIFLSSDLSGWWKIVVLHFLIFQAGGRLLFCIFLICNVSGWWKATKAGGSKFVASFQRGKTAGRRDTSPFPTFDPFLCDTHTPHIAQVMCQSGRTKIIHPVLSILSHLSERYSLKHHHDQTSVEQE